MTVKLRSKKSVEESVPFSTGFNHMVVGLTSGTPKGPVAPAESVELAVPNGKSPRNNGVDK